MDHLITRKSAIRHLIQLGITAVLLVWSYVAISLLTDNWNWFALEQSMDAKLQVGNIVGFSLMFVGVAVAGILTYWNAKKWMLPCLKRSGLYFLGVIPFVNLLVPAEMMNSWWEEISALNTSDGTVTTYYDRYGKLYSTDGSIPLIFAIPLGVLKALAKGIGLGVANLVAAIGIPVFAPVFLVLGLLATQLLTNWSNTAALIIAVVCMIAIVFVLIIQPVIVLRKNHAVN